MIEKKIKFGLFSWADLTVKDTTPLKAFYKEIFGWKEHPVDMKDEEGAYQDFAMMADETTPVGGICHQRGVNHNIPSQWIMYVSVENVETTLQKCLQLGGELIHGNKKKDGAYGFVIVKDPQGHIFGFGNM